MNVLITAVSGPTAIGIIKCLKDLEDIKIIGTDIYNNSIGKKWLDEIVIVPKNDKEDEYKAKLKSIIKEKSIDIVFPTMQEELEMVQKIAVEMEIYSAIVSGFSIKKLLNKKDIYDELIKKGLGLYVPKYKVFNNVISFEKAIQNSFNSNNKICIKKTSGHGGKGFIVISLDKKEYIQNIQNGMIYIDDYKDYLVESNIREQMMVCDFIEGEEVSVDILRHDNIIISIVPRARNRVSTGIVIDGKIKNIPEIIDAARKIANQFNIEGFVNMQFIYNSQNVMLIDLNPRFCGSQVMSYGAGVNFPKMICDIAQNKKLDIIEPKWNYESRRYWESVFYDDNHNII